MKRQMILAAFLSVCMLSIAQSEENYSMYVYLSDGSVEAYSVSDVDSVVFVDATEDVVSSDTTYINGYAAVDLGLSILWATCNIGADSPEDYGDYFAWGETEPKDTFNTDNSVTYGVSMSDISGDAEYDAATANWGDSWRMPTYDEMKELFDNCTWTWTWTVNSQVYYGYKVTSNVNGNSIYLPAAGYRNGTSLINAGSVGVYWSSSPYSRDPYNAYCLSFGSSFRSMGYSRRYYGRSVRPVSDY